MSMMLAADDIRNLRTALRISQRELAEKLGVHQTAVSEWELGKSYPRVPHYLKLIELQAAAQKTRRRPSA